MQGGDRASSTQAVLFLGTAIEQWESGGGGGGGAQAAGCDSICGEGAKRSIIAWAGTVLLALGLPPGWAHRRGSPSA